MEQIEYELRNAMSKAIDTHHEVIRFGKHRGTKYPRIPVSYLRWMVNTKTPEWDYAKAELDRRGTTLPKIEVSAHAIDRASEHCLGNWHYDKAKGEGLYSWLSRVTLEAIAEGKQIEEEKYQWKDMKFVIAQGYEYPVLKTVMK